MIDPATGGRITTVPQEPAPGRFASWITWSEIDLVQPLHRLAALVQQEEQVLVLPDRRVRESDREGGAGRDNRVQGVRQP